MNAKRRAVRSIAGLVTVALVLLTTGCGAVGGGGGTRYSALFRTAIGVYPNADVRVLGVPVGKIDAVTPQGDLVKVDFHVDPEVRVPADAKAAVVAPTVVADRYLQLTPVYTGGPTMPEGMVIPRERTASPPEFDDLLASAQKLSTALGPDGVNKDGALSQALTTAAKNLRGNGQQLNTTLDNTSQAITTLSASRDNLANTTRNLQSFTTNLKGDDGRVREFTRQFAEVNTFLVDERDDLGETLKELSEALGEVADFVRDNRPKVKQNAQQLAGVLQTLNNERLALEQVLEVAGIALDGLVNTYDAASASLDARADLLSVTLCLVGSNLPEPLQVPFIQLLELAFPGQGQAQTCAALAGALGGKVPASALKTQLNDPKVLASLTNLMALRQAQLKNAPVVPAAPKLVFPLVAPRSDAAGPVLPPPPTSGGGAARPALPLVPGEPRNAVGNLLGGGR